MDREAEQVRIAYACNMCRISHAACESTRPCWRCVSMGKAHLCADVVLRKRGRPRKDLAKSPSSSTTGKDEQARQQQQHHNHHQWNATVHHETLRAPKTMMVIHPPQVLLSHQATTSAYPFQPISSSPCSSSSPPSSSPSYDDAVKEDQTKEGPSLFFPPSTSFSSSLPSSGRPQQPAERELTRRDRMLENIVLFTLDELRQLKQHNRDLTQQLRQVSKRQAKDKKALRRIKSEHNATQRRDVSAQRRQLQPSAELLAFLPFLTKYSIPPDRFVVDDTRKAFLVIRMVIVPLNQSHETKRSARFVFLNDACTQLLGYTLSDLLGREMNSMSYLDAEVKRQVVKDRLQGAPRSVSCPVPVPLFMQCKNGQVFLCNCRSQFFYNQHGLADWCVIAIDSFRELSCDELPSGWLLHQPGVITTPVVDDVMNHPQPWLWAKSSLVQQPASTLPAPSPQDYMPPFLQHSSSPQPHITEDSEWSWLASPAGQPGTDNIQW